MQHITRGIPFRGEVAINKGRKAQGEGRRGQVRARVRRGEERCGQGEGKGREGKMRSTLDSVLALLA